jgi:hypothetical protein
MPEPLEESIQQNAQGPAKATTDGSSMEQHPLPDQIAADRYLASKQATKRKGPGIKLLKISPPGTST